MTWENAQVVKRTEAVTHFIGLDEQPLSVVRFHQYEIPQLHLQHECYGATSLWGGK